MNGLRQCEIVGQLLFQIGEKKLAIDNYFKTVEIARNIKEGSFACVALYTLANLLFDSEREDQIESLLMESEARCNKDKFPHDYHRILGSWGLLYRRRKRAYRQHAD